METRKARNRKRKKRNKKVARIGSLVFILFTLVVIYYIKENIINKDEKSIVAENIDRKSELVKKGDKQNEAIEEQDEVQEISSEEEKGISHTYDKYTIYEKNTSNESINFWFGKNESNAIPGSPISDKLTEKYNCHYVGNIDNVMYLTFDEGVDVTHANQNLDTLKEHNIKATFFLTGDFIKDHPDIVNRISNEGHVCANHTFTHLDMASLAQNNPESFLKEVVETEKAFYEVTNKEMDKFIRLPEGTYSEKVLDYLNQMGYTTVFWSFAIKDWSEEWNTKDEVLQNMKKYYHQGGIYLLHGLNKANAEALGDFIKYMGSIGYRFDVVSNIS